MRCFDRAATPVKQPLAGGESTSHLDFLQSQVRYLQRALMRPRMLGRRPENAPLTDENLKKRTRM